LQAVATPVLQRFMVKKKLLGLVVDLELLVMALAVTPPAIHKFLALADVSLQAEVHGTLVARCSFSDLLVRELKIESQLIKSFGHAACYLPSE